MNHEVAARMRVRSFIRKIKSRGWLQTGNGVRNYLASLSETGVVIQPKRSNLPYKLTRTCMEKAAYMMFWKRYITISDLRGYSSALFGVLCEMFQDIARFTRSATGQLRLALRGIRVNLSGADSSLRDLKIAASAGGQFPLMSYYYLREQKGRWINNLEECGIKQIFLD